MIFVLVGLYVISTFHNLSITLYLLKPTQCMYIMQEIEGLMPFLLTSIYKSPSVENTPVDVSLSRERNQCL